MYTLPQLYRTNVQIRIAHSGVRFQSIFYYICDIMLNTVKHPYNEVLGTGDFITLLA